MPQQNINSNEPEPIVVRYCGYIERPVGRPVLVFDNGFLVLDDPDPTKVGWYRRGGVTYWIHTQVNDTILEAINVGKCVSEMRLTALNRILADYLTETVRAQLGIAQAPSVGKAHYVIVQADQLEVNGAVVGYAFPNSRYIRANDPRCDPQWSEQNALQIAGDFDDEGFPTTHAHVQPEEGVRVFSSGQPLDYIGYARLGTAAPTLFFKTGFLVQASRNPAAIGWYAYRHQHQVMANMTAVYNQAAMLALGQRRDSWATLYADIKEAVMDEIEERLLRRGSSEGERQCIVVDSPDPEVVDSATFFSFYRSRVRPGDVNFDPTFNAAYAAQAVGPLDANGRPTDRPSVPFAEGVVVINY